MTNFRFVTVFNKNFTKEKIFIVLLVLLVSYAQAEKEPIEAEVIKSVDPPSVKGHYLDKAEVNTENGEESKSNLGFIHAFIASLSVIIVSELGDKTFFIAAIMAMRHPRLTVFIGAITALALMTVLSVAFGWAATIIPRAYTYYISTALFALFGLKMLKEGYYMSANEGQEEFEEVQLDLRKRDDEAENQDLSQTSSPDKGPDCDEEREGKEYEKETSATLVQDPESGIIRKAGKSSRTILSLISRVFIQSFTLTFVAEWGDRSQLTTIILAAREDVFGVTIGGVLGHSLCTGLAVLGGRMIAQKISVRTVTLIGGVVFLLFAVTALFFDPNAET